MRDVEHKHVADVVEVPCQVIRPSKKQQRETSKEEGIDALIEGIRARGQVQPALIRPIIGGSEYKYELVSGERRWRACTTLNRPLKAVILAVNGSEEQYALSCIANNQQALTPMEICNSLHVLYDNKEMQHVKKEKRMEATARRYFGRGHQWAWGYWGLYRLDARLQPLVKRSCPIGEFLPTKIAVRLAGLPEGVPDIQVKTWEEIQVVLPPMSVTAAQQHITIVKRKWAERGKFSKGRPQSKRSLRFRRFIDNTLKEMEPIMVLAGGHELRLEVQACDTRKRRGLEEDLTGMIERLEVMREVVRKVMSSPEAERVA